MDPKYPIGRFKRPDHVDGDTLQSALARMAAAPRAMRDAVAGLAPAQLDTPYRDGGWTVRQVVHHVPDSHMNAFIRIKLALTEDEPTIRPYDETAWARLADVTVVPVETSLTLLDSLQSRWVALLRALGSTDLARTFRHPESGVWRIDQVALMYAWHGDHHVAHITNLRTRSGW